MGRACLFCGYPLKIGANEESIRCPACERENREELFPVIVRWEEEGLPFDRIYLQTNFPFGSSLLVGKGQKAVLKGAGEETALSEGRHDLFLRSGDPSVLYLDEGKYRIDAGSVLLFTRTESSVFRLRSEQLYEAGKTGVMLKPEYRLGFPPVTDVGKIGGFAPEDLQKKILTVMDQYASKAAASLPAGVPCGSSEDKKRLIQLAETAFPDMDAEMTADLEKVLPMEIFPENAVVSFALSDEAASGKWECSACGRKIQAEEKKQIRCPNCGEPLFWCSSCGKYVRRTNHAWCAECGVRIYPTDF